jgi:hypothetical protein
VHFAGRAPGGAKQRPVRIVGDTGRRHVLIEKDFQLVMGSTENATVCQSLLVDLPVQTFTTAVSLARAVAILAQHYSDEVCTAHLPLPLVQRTPQMQ